VPHLDRVADIKKKGLECIGHIIRVNNETVVKKIFESEPGGRRRKRRPRLRWMEDVEKVYVRKTIKMHNFLNNVFHLIYAGLVLNK
jgi:hypothetical protein